MDKCDGQKLVDATLLAIYLGHIQISEACILHPTFKALADHGAFKDDNMFWQRPSSDDAQFAPDITPLILAAQYNRTEIGKIDLIFSISSIISIFSTIINSSWTSNNQTT